MKKNLAKRIVLGLLTGAVLMSSSVAWAADVSMSSDTYSVYTFKDGTDPITTSFGVGYSKVDDEIKPGSITSGSTNSIVIGINSKINGEQSIALGNDAKVEGGNSVALGYGSVADAPNVVSVGSGNVSDAYATRKIVNVTKGELDTDAVNVGQLNTVENNIYGKIGLNNEGELDLAGTYAASSTTLSGAIKVLDNMIKTNYEEIDGVVGEGLTSVTSLNLLKKEYSLTTAIFQLDSYVYNNKQAIEGIINNGTITVNKDENAKNPVTIDQDGITIGTNSTRMDSTGFYAGRIRTGQTDPHDYANARAAITEDGKIKGATGKFEVGTDGSVKAADGAFKVDANGNVTAKEVTAENLYTKEQVNELIGGSNASVAGLNQRLEKTNAKINKVGAGAAALAALHPLDYDPDDKLTFSAGMGNYAGENAAALGAFYRPNEKFMLSLGGTMGNGENMVNLGLSIGLDRASGLAKLSKKELIQKVNAVEAENDALEDRVAKLEALVAQLASK